MEEKQAVALLKGGDPGGLETLVNLHQLQALRAAALITGDPALAEDIVQNAFVRTFERINQFDDQRAFKPWFLRIVVNDAIKAVNRQKRQVSIEQDGQEELSFLVDPSPLPEEQVELLETRQAVQRALACLPPSQRAAIVMRYYLGMNEDEMTQKTHKSTGTIKWRLHTSRKLLEQFLRPILRVFTSFPNQED